MRPTAVTPYRSRSLPPRLRGRGHDQRRAETVLLPAVALLEGDHDFANQRTLLGIPYAMDVLINLAFHGFDVALGVGPD